MGLILSPKMKRFLKYNSKNLKVECLEGQTSAGKTTVGAFKFFFKCYISKELEHIMACDTLGIAEKNVINGKLGLLDLLGKSGVNYYGNGFHNNKLPCIVWNQIMKVKKKILENGVWVEKIVEEEVTKKIYISGYGDSTTWKNVLGKQYGCAYIDEVNTANIDFVREVAMRCNYLMATLNPDDPNLPIYKELINRCRPLKEYEKDYPSELLSQIYSEKSEDGYVHWFFTMDDNAALTKEKKEQIRKSIPQGSKQYKNKILGVRGRSEGLVYESFSREKHVIDIADFKWLPNEKVFRIVCGLDSGLKADATGLASIFLTTAGRFLIMPSMYYVPREGTNSNSHQAKMTERWLADLQTRFLGHPVPNQTTIVCDSAAITQALAIEINNQTMYNVIKVDKKDIRADTLRLIGLWEAKDYAHIINAGYIDPITRKKKSDLDMLIVELENNIWDKKKGDVPEDGNDHLLDAIKYALYYLWRKHLLEV